MSESISPRVYKLLKTKTLEAGDQAKAPKFVLIEHLDADRVRYICQVIGSEVLERCSLQQLVDPGRHNGCVW